MHLKPKKIDVDANIPFANDLLDREQYAKVLTKLILEADEGFTLSIDAEWGYGKTTFVKMWMQMLSNEGVNTIYLNAWETDFARDPMMALVDSLAQSIEKVDFDEDCRKLLSPIVDGLIRLAKSIPGISWAGNIAEATKNVVDSAMEDKTPLDEYRTYSSIVAELHDKIAQFVQKSPSKKIVIFVDELDRCRPDYAIEMLERIKHLFSIPNIVFVLSIDKSVILECIKGFYNSSKINAENYLRRFIDLNFTLPTPSMLNFVEEQYEYHRFEFNKERIESITKCFDITSRSLRDIEKYFNLLDITLRSIGRNNICVDIVVWLVYAKLFKTDVYGRLRTTEMEEDKLLLFLESHLLDIHSKIKEENDACYLSYSLCVLAISYCREYNKAIMNNEEIQKFRYKHIRTINFQNIHSVADNNANESDLKYIMQQIDMVNSHFQ